MNNPTPNWKAIRHDDPQSHSALVYVARIMFSDIVESVDLSKLPDVNIQPAVECGYVIIQEEKIVFMDRNILQEYIARHAAEDMLLKVWDDLVEFTKVLIQIQHRFARLDFDPETETDVLLILAHEHDKNLLNRIVDAATWGQSIEGRNDPFWSLYSAFCRLLPQLDISPTLLARDLEPVLLALDGDSANGEIYGAIEDLAKTSLTKAKLLFNAFIAQTDSPVVGLSGNALVAMATFDLEAAHETALQLVDSELRIIRRVGIFALGRFEYAEDLDNGRLCKTLNRFESLLSTPSSEIDDVLTSAYGCLLKLKDAEDTASRALINLATRTDPAVHLQLSGFLFSRKSKTYKAPWFQKVLLGLACVNSSHSRSVQNLDWCAAEYVLEFPEVALNFLRKFIVSRDYGREGDDYLLQELFGTTVTSLRKHHYDRLTEAVTEWFASEDPRLHRAARDLVEHRAYYSPDDSEPLFRLSKAVLNELEVQDVLDLLTRILGWVTYGRPLASLLTSALDRDPCTDVLRTFVAEHLSEYVLYNYPGEVGEYLQGLLEGEDDECANIQHKVIRKALEDSKSYFEARRVLPRAKEFEPSSRHMYLFQIARQKQHSFLMEKAHEKSILLRYASKVPLKYGRGYFTKTEEGFSFPSQLGSFRQEFEVPQGEQIDPLGQRLRRSMWQQTGLTELPDEIEEVDGEACDT